MDTRESPQSGAGLTDELPPPSSIGAWLAQNAFTLLVVAGVAVFFYWMQVDFLQAAKVALGLGVVIFIHELGHFLAAKWCDVHVQTFSIGFGPALPGCSFRRGETTYKVALFPVGGYVKMVGESPESEDGSDDDPRSFKNKPVGQRMLIISAGVIMNVILAAVCFVGVFNTTGVEKIAAVIGHVDAGSPAWQAGLRPGSDITRIGGSERPTFDDLMGEVMNWTGDTPIPIDYRFDGVSGHIDPAPRPNDLAGKLMLGIGPADSSELIDIRGDKSPPVVPGSAASRAKPPFEAGDVIVATTDPDDPTRVTPLPDDPRTPVPGKTDYFALTQRLQRLAGREMTMTVRRKNGTTADIVVPPAFHTYFGITLTMGPVQAVRSGSTAQRADVRAKSAAQDGDVITAIEVSEGDGKTLRYSSVKSTKLAANVRELPLDPMRLPSDLRRWAGARGTEARSVKLTLERTVGHAERQETTVEVEWDNSWRYVRSSPNSLTSPLAIDELGIAFQVLARVAGVEAGSPAAMAGVAAGDVIKAVQYYDNSKTGEPKPLRWIDLKNGQAARPFYVAQRDIPSRMMGLTLQRDKEELKVTLQGTEDSTWPLAERGLVFERDKRLQKADSLGEALQMGARSTWRVMTQIYQSLHAMITGKIDFVRNASGPFAIAQTSYAIAGESLTQFIFFLGMISINLAVINFLPIPVLDGGHMFFLIWEKLFGKPPPERVLVGATLTGLALILSLMVFVSYLDVKKWLQQ